MFTRILSPIHLTALVLLTTGCTVLLAGTPCSAQPVVWQPADGGNGHTYEAFLCPAGVTWPAVNDATAALSTDWHLATITSAEENAFLYDLIEDDPAFWDWAGGNDNSSGPALGGFASCAECNDWAWVTGEPWEYTNWASGEPNPLGYVLQFFGYHTSMSPKWNDAWPTSTLPGYILECPDGGNCPELNLDPTCLPLSGERVDLDIKPTSCPNPFNPNQQGVTPVAILATADFDVNEIDVSSLLLALPEGTVAPIRSSIEDVAAPVVDPELCECTTAGPDGFDDLTLKLDSAELAAALGDAQPGDQIELCIMGTLLDGTSFDGCDCIFIPGPVATGAESWGAIKVRYR